MHVAKDQMSKLDNKWKPCIFLGYSQDEFSYMLWDLVNKMVVRSWDIVFLEGKVIEDQKQHNLESLPSRPPLMLSQHRQGWLSCFCRPIHIDFSYANKSFLPLPSEAFLGMTSFVESPLLPVDMLPSATCLLVSSCIRLLGCWFVQTISILCHSLFLAKIVVTKLCFSQTKS